MKYPIVIIIIMANILAYGQVEISNKEYFKNFFDSKGKNLLLIGENHASSAASTIYPRLIKYHQKKNELKTLLLEFGPAEAYFYSKYLETGNEKFFGYTIYAGFYKDWKKAWRKIYKYNKTLEEPLKIRGMDFDRTRTFAYALYNIFKEYPEKPKQIDSLMNVIKSQEFFKAYTIGYPTEKDKKFVSETKKILIQNKGWWKKTLNKKDQFVVYQMVENHTTDFGKDRENNISQNIKNLIKNSEEKNFLMLVGRDHAYRKGLWDDKDKLAFLLNKNADFNILSGVILHQNSQLWDKDFKKEITLFEVRNKDPWKTFSEKIQKKIKDAFTIIPLTDDLETLNKYTDYILIAENQRAIDF